MAFATKEVNLSIDAQDFPTNARVIPSIVLLIMDAMGDLS